MRTKSAYPLMGLALATLAVCTQPSLADQYSDGTAAYSARNFAAAKAHFIKATQAKPKQWEAHYQLANTYVQLKDGASAKASYQKCMALNPPADVKGMCTNALAVIARNPTLAPPPAPKAPWHVQMIRPKEATLPEPPADTAQGGKDGDKDKDKKTADAKPEENVKPEIAEKRAKIMKKADEDIENFKKNEKIRHDEEAQNSNQRVVQADGSVKYGLNEAEEAQYQKDLEKQITAMRDKAKKEAANIK